jgi:hypothetical protein
MNETPRKLECRPVNLAALRRDLEEMAAKIKSSGRPAATRPEDFQGPTLVIRGK